MVPVKWKNLAVINLQFFIRPRRSVLTFEKVFSCGRITPLSKVSIFTLAIRPYLTAFAIGIKFHGCDIHCFFIILDNYLFIQAFFQESCRPCMRIIFFRISAFSFSKNEPDNIIFASGIKAVLLFRRYDVVWRGNDFRKITYFFLIISWPLERKLHLPLWWSFLMIFKIETFMLSEIIKNLKSGILRKTFSVQEKTVRQPSLTFDFPLRTVL